MKNSTYVKVTVPSVRIAGEKLPVRFRSNKKNGAVRASCTGHKNIVIRQAKDSSSYEAFTVGQYRTSCVTAREPAVAFARAVHKYWN